MATSRLKKRIEQVSNEDDSNKGYGNLLESFVSYGKALPSLASTSKDSNEFVPIWKQEVHDEQGRRRLHGAFTGGFSAGYFNTVGSKEGWTPKAFTSSRSTRATKDDQTTEDLAKSLMDDEDLADLRSAQTLQTNSAYSNPTPSYDPLSGHSNSPSLAPTAALASLIQPSTARIGLKLMRKMGWREGQGVGPRVTLEQRRIMAKELGIQIEEEDASEEAARHYYAPLDRPLNTLKEVGASADRGWGLGYLPSGSLSASARIAPNTTSAQWSYINDTDNIYSTADSIGFGINGEKVRPKWVVDLEVQDEDEGEYAINASGERAGQPLAKRTSKDSNMATFHDSTACLPGFKIQRETNYGASTSQLPPPPPTRWKPEPSRIWQGTGSGTDSKGKGREMDADQRGNLLGEPQPAPVAKSVFDYMSAKSRERLAQISSNPSSFTPGTSSNSTPLINNSRVPPPPILEPDDPLNIPTLEAPTALAALSGFQPFSVNSASADAIRQARYTLFLQFQARLLPPTALPSSLPFGPRTLPTGKVQTIKELNRELDDYARAARVFKPVSGMLAGRFTSNVTGTTLEVPTVTPGLSQPKPKAIIIPTEINDGNQLIENLTPAQSAARAGMFGRMTRTLDDFHPAKLLCKRFGIRNPHPDREDEEEEVGGAWKEAGRGAVSRKPAGDILNKESMEQLMKSSGFRKFESPSQTTISTKDLSLIEDIPINTQLKEERKTLANVGLGEDETQGAEILTYTKAPADIFAAIFADSDDEDDEDDIPLPIPSKPSTTTLNTSQMSPIATQLPEPSSISAAIEEEPLSMENLSSYRPSFSKTSKESTVPVEKKKKKSKRKAAKAALSFEIEEGEEVMEFSSKKKIKTNASAPTMKVEDEWTVAEPSVHQSILNTQVNRSKASDLF